MAQPSGADRPFRPSAQELREVEPREQGQAEAQDRGQLSQVWEQVRRAGTDARLVANEIIHRRSFFSIAPDDLAGFG